MPIGTQGGERGLTTPENSQRVAAWLAKQAPADMDKAAVWRASSYGVTLKVNTEWRFPEGRASYAVCVGCDVLPGGDRDKALADLQNFMQPATKGQIEAWLAELSVLVVRRADDAVAEGARLSAFSKRLSAFPADIVRVALLETPHKFWPSWVELEEICKSLAAPRVQMIAALKRGPALPEPTRRPATEEERARIQDMIDKMFPNATGPDRHDAVNEALKGDCMKDEGHD
ncbi:MAG: hypothetical protein U5N55_05075 [Cypionkella sp.]|nr:hypothetical protein [Cypionkella sp.]